MSNINFTVETAVDMNGTITQATCLEFDGVRERLYREVVNLREQGIRDALIKLGWTPPPITK